MILLFSGIKDMKMIISLLKKFIFFEFIARLIRHIPEPQFKTIRYYGFYASKKHKLYNSCKKLIDGVKLPFINSLNKW